MSAFLSDTHRPFLRFQCYNRRMGATNENIQGKGVARIFWLFLYFLCLYLAVNAIPFSRFIASEHLCLGLSLLAKTLLLGYAVWECFRPRNRTLFSFHKLRRNNLLWLPLILPCLSNILYAACFSGSFFPALDAGKAALAFADDFIVAILEEILFRGILFIFFITLFQNKKNGVVYSILLSSIAFGAIHLVNIFSNPPLAVLAQVAYSFLLGAILSLVYLGSGNFVLPILGHFLFNASNDTIPSMFSSYSMDVTYYVWSAILGAFGLLYAVGIAIVMKRRKTHVS